MEGEMGGERYVVPGVRGWRGEPEGERYVLSGVRGWRERWRERGMC